MEAKMIGLQWNAKRARRLFWGAMFGIVLHGALFAQPNFWQEASGDFPNGDVTDLVINPSGHIFAGTNFGIYRSTNDGATWTRLTSGIVFSLGVHPNGDLYASECLSSNCGLQKSTDNGATWLPAGFPSNYVFMAIAIRTNGTIFAAARDTVYRSTNNGATWSPSDASFPSNPDEGVSALGLASGLVFAGITDINVPTGYGTIRRSTDDGSTWSSFSPQWSGDWINGIVRNSLGYTFAATNFGIRRSTDFGATWTLTPGINNQRVTGIAINSVGYLFATCGDLISNTNGGVLRSTNRGDSWVQMNNGLTNSSVSAVAMNTNSVVYAGTTHTGMFRSADTAATWTLINLSMFSENVEGLTTLANGTICAATLDGMFASSDNGATWRQRNVGLQSLFINTLHQNTTGTLYAGLDGSGAARSTDGGLLWTSINSGITTQRVFSLASKTGGLLFAGAQNGAFLSTNGGDTWLASGSGPSSFVRSIVVLPSGEIIAGSGAGVYLSTDNGVSWSPRNSGLTNTSVGSLIRSQNGDLFAGVDGTVFRSTNNGTNWLAAGSGLPTMFINALAFGANGLLFASAGDSGVYQSTNDGTSWTAMNSGLPTPGSSSSAIGFTLGQSGYLFAGVRSGSAFGGVYRTSQPTTSVGNTSQELPTTFVLNQNYPNPFNPSTRIEYAIPARSHVSITIYNLLGQEVAFLADEAKPAGRHAVEWNGRSMNGATMGSGVYFYRAEARQTNGQLQFTNVKKMLLLK